MSQALIAPPVKPKHRVEGRAKVSGAARFVDDLRADEIGFQFAIGVPVTSTIARGRIVSIDSTATLAVPGVRLVLSHLNAPRLRKFTALTMSETAERLPLQDDEVRWHGECVAVVVADDLLSAREGARLLAITYDQADTSVAATLNDGKDRLSPVKRAGIAPGRVMKGDPDDAYASAPVRIEAEYHTACFHHNSIEPTAVIARWDEDGGVTIHAAVQWHHVDTLAVGQAFGLGLADQMPGFLSRKLLGASFEGKVRLQNHLAGGAFGRNLSTPHLFLACMAAKVAGMAVKVPLSTQNTFGMLSYRGEVKQRIRLGATRGGKLSTVMVEADVGVGAVGSYVEPVGSWSCHVYDQPNHSLQHHVAKLDLNGVGWMRAPGGASAMFALESAMDELARVIRIDPLELRLLNHSINDPVSGKPWDRKKLKECYEQGADAIGW